MANDDFGKIIPKRPLDSHKGDYGHLLILAGSAGLTGAAYLCSQGALLSGSGLVTLGIPRSLNSIMEVKLTEVMTRPLAETKDLSLSLASQSEILKLVERSDAVAIGPGLSRNRETQKLVRRLIPLIEKPMVLDADGINALIGGLSTLREAKGPLVITPHPGEMARLMGIGIDEVQESRKDKALDFAKGHNVIVVLKGYNTIVCNPGGNIYTNTTGNPGMATGGVGDILTGMMAAFLAQGLQPFEAARLAVYLHGLAGDLAAEEKGQPSLIAADILDKLPGAFKTTGSSSR